MSASLGGTGESARRAGRCGRAARARAPSGPPRRCACTRGSWERAGERARAKEGTVRPPRRGAPSPLGDELLLQPQRLEYLGREVGGVSHEVGRRRRWAVGRVRRGREGTCLCPVAEHRLLGQVLGQVVHVDGLAGRGELERGRGGAPRFWELEAAKGWRAGAAPRFSRRTPGGRNSPLRTPAQASRSGSPPPGPACAPASVGCAGGVSPPGALTRSRRLRTLSMSCSLRHSRMRCSSVQVLSARGFSLW